MAPSSDGLRAASYLRTSGEGQRDNTSIPRQREETDRLILQNGWTSVRSYVDECKSGSKIAGRDAFQQMMKDAAKGEFDVVAVYDITRYGRDGADIIESARTLKRDFGVDVVDTKGTFDTRDNSRVLMNFVGAGIAEHERLSILDRTIKGRIANAKAGKPWSGNLPIGRGYDEKEQVWYITEIGKAIHEALRRYVDGESLTALAREIKGIRRGKVSEWVAHGQLAGRYSVHFQCRDLNLEMDVSVPAVPPLVSEKLLEAVKRRLMHNRTNNRVDVQQYLLSGYLRCRDCGKNLTSQTQRGVVYYRHKRSPGCTLAGVRGDEIEPSTLDFLYRFFLDEPAFQKAALAACPSTDHRDGLASQLDTTEKRLAKNIAATRRLVDAIADGADIGLLLSKQGELKAESETLRNRSKELRAEIASLPDAATIHQAAQRTRLMLMLMHQNRDWRSLPYDEIRAFLAQLFGDNLKKSNTGVFLRVDGGQRLTATFEGQVEFHHRMVDGRPINLLLEAESKRLSAQLRREFEKELASLRTTDPLKPYPDNELSVPPRAATDST